jgi:DNA-binding LacI/PurR family transcriptional regulator
MSVMMVAKLAQVPYSTAWRVINRKANVAPDAVERVLRAAREIGYDPQQPRRGRRTRTADGIRTRNIALLHLRMNTTLSLSVLRMVEQQLGMRNLNLIVAHVGTADDLPHAVRTGNVDGILGYGQFPKGVGNGRLSSTPAVWMMTRYDFEPDEWGDRVQPNHKMIGRLAAHYLLKHGHEHLAFFAAGSPQTAPAIADRWTAFHAAATDLAGSVRMVSTSHDSHIDVGFEKEVERAADELISMNHRPTGVFVSTDRIARVMHRALINRGIRINKDMEIISCDNEAELLADLSPRPVSVDLHKREIARQAVERLLWRIRHGVESPQVLMEVTPSLPELSDAGETPPADSSALVS